MRGAAIAPATCVFVKHESEDGFEVHEAADRDGPGNYTRCDAKKEDGK